MYKVDVIAYYGTGVKVTSALELKSSGTVSGWADIIPEKHALRLTFITDGELAYRPELYRSTETIAAV